MEEDLSLSGNHVGDTVTVSGNGSESASRGDTVGVTGVLDVPSGGLLLGLLGGGELPGGREDGGSEEGRVDTESNGGAEETEEVTVDTASSHGVLVSTNVTSSSLLEGLELGFGGGILIEHSTDKVARFFRHRTYGLGTTVQEEAGHTGFIGGIKAALVTEVGELHGHLDVSVRGHRALLDKVLTIGRVGGYDEVEVADQATEVIVRIQDVLLCINGEGERETTPRTLVADLNSLRDIGPCGDGYAALARSFAFVGHAINGVVDALGDDVRFFHQVSENRSIGPRVFAVETDLTVGKDDHGDRLVKPDVGAIRVAVNEGLAAVGPVENFSFGVFQGEPEESGFDVFEGGAVDVGVEEVLLTDHGPFVSALSGNGGEGKFRGADETGFFAHLGVLADVNEDALNLPGGTKGSIALVQVNLVVTALAGDDNVADFGGVVVLDLVDFGTGNTGSGEDTFVLPHTQGDVNRGNRDRADFLTVELFLEAHEGVQQTSSTGFGDVGRAPATRVENVVIGIDGDGVTTFEVNVLLPPIGDVIGDEHGLGLEQSVQFRTRTLEELGSGLLGVFELFRILNLFRGFQILGHGVIEGGNRQSRQAGLEGISQRSTTGEHMDKEAPNLHVESRLTGLVNKSLILQQELQEAALKTSEGNDSSRGSQGGESSNLKQRILVRCQHRERSCW